MFLWLSEHLLSKRTTSKYFCVCTFEIIFKINLTFMPLSPLELYVNENIHVVYINYNLYGPMNSIYIKMDLKFRFYSGENWEHCRKSTIIPRAIENMGKLKKLNELNCKKF